MLHRCRRHRHRFRRWKAQLISRRERRRRRRAYLRAMLGLYLINYDVNDASPCPAQGARLGDVILQAGDLEFLRWADRGVYAHTRIDRMTPVERARANRLLRLGLLERAEHFRRLYLDLTPRARRLIEASCSSRTRHA